MLKLILLLSINFIFSQSNNLFISEYAETQSSADRYVEIYNGTLDDIDLSEYTLKITKSGGNSSEYELSLDNTDFDSNNNGTLTSSSVLLIINFKL